MEAVRVLALALLLGAGTESSQPTAGDGGAVDSSSAADAGIGDAGGGAVDAGSQAGPRSCAEIEGAYEVTLKAARTCDPDAATEPCTLRASTSPGCGCPLNVNGTKTTERMELSRLTYEYGDAGCDLNACPTSCPPLDDYRCQPRGECAVE